MDEKYGINDVKILMAHCSQHQLRLPPKKYLSVSCFDGLNSDLTKKRKKNFRGKTYFHRIHAKLLHFFNEQF